VDNDFEDEDSVDDWRSRIDVFISGLPVVDE
jgi:hypothetical protein